MYTREIKSFTEIKKGDKFMVVDNLNGNNYPINKILTAQRNGTKTDDRNSCVNNFAEEGVYNNVYISSIRIGSQSVKEMHDELERLEKEYKSNIKELRRKIEFCKSIGIDEYDEDTVKVYETLKILESTDSNIERAKQIAKLLK